MPLFNPLITHIANATPEDAPVARRSLYWAVVFALLAGLAVGRYSVFMG